VNPRSSPRVVALLGTVFPHQHAVLAAAREAGADVTLVGSKKNPYEGKWPWQVGSPPSLHAIYLEPRCLLAKGNYQKWWYPALRSTLRRLEPEIVHVLAEPWTPLALNALAASIGCPSRPRLCIHGCANIYAHGGAARHAARRASLRIVLPPLAGFASWNEEGVELARTYGLRPNIPTTVIPAIVPDPSEFAPLNEDARRAARTELALPEDDLVVTFIGRLEPQKGIIDAVTATSMLDGGAPLLAIWGTGPERDHVQRVAIERRVRALFGPALGPRQVARALAASDVLVVPSHTTRDWKEQFGRIAVEGMLAETAVVAYDSGALPKVVSDGGVLVSEGDVRALADTIARLAADPGLRVTVGARGRASALERFHPRSLGAELVEFWNEVLAA
jgi:glycosyltransferase involved in cell wall biosynthesis